MKKILYTYLIVFGTLGSAYSQIDPLLFQQSHLRTMVNPAATGKGGDINASLSIRQQWVGFDGTSTQVLLADGFANSIRSGFGVSCILDGYGFQQTKNIKLNYAYFIPFDEAAFLTLGMGTGVMNNVYKGGDCFIYRDPDDDAIPSETQSKTLPDFDFGIEFNTVNFEMGASIAHITYGYNDQAIMRPMRNYIIYSRVKVPMNKNWDFIPGATWHYNRKATTFEFNSGLR